MRVVLTGSAGFVGRSLLTALVDAGHIVTPVVRCATTVLDPRARPFVTVDLATEIDWLPIVQGQDVVVHAAARVHVISDTEADPMAAFRRVNTTATLRLAHAAAQAGVRRFIFLSTIKVNGEETLPGCPFTAQDIAQPSDPYAVSKHEAETGLRQIGTRSGMEIVVVRPPLVYGPGVQGNFATMLRWLRRGVPLPLASVTGNRRSLVALGNLVDLLVQCVDMPAAANQVFLVSDGEDLSTAVLLRRLAAALGCRSRLFPVPTGVLSMLGRVLGRRATVQRLCGNLQVDIGHTRRQLGWAPPMGVDDGLRRAGGSLPKVRPPMFGKRAFDVVLACSSALLLLLPCAIVWLLVRMTSRGPALYWSDRVGRNNAIFRMPKFRSMRIDTPAVATHLMVDPASYLTRIGPFLRKSSLDEIPQLWSIVKGDMSFVGPRPALFNQYDLIALRTAHGVHTLMPGLTGWAQINGRDEIPIPDKVALDVQYLQKQSFWFDLKILALTAVKVMRRDNVTH